MPISLTQVAEVFTGTPGKYVTLEKTLSGFGGILTGKYDDLPEMAFYMVSVGQALPGKAIQASTLFYKAANDPVSPRIKQLRRRLCGQCWFRLLRSSVGDRWCDHPLMSVEPLTGECCLLGERTETKFIVCRKIMTTFHST